MKKKHHLIKLTIMLATLGLGNVLATTFPASEGRNLVGAYSDGSSSATQWPDGLPVDLEGNLPVTPIYRLMNINHGVKFNLRKGKYVRASEFLVDLLGPLASEDSGKSHKAVSLKDQVAISISPELDWKIIKGPLVVDNEKGLAGRQSAFDSCKFIASRLGIEFEWNDATQTYEFRPKAEQKKEQAALSVQQIRKMSLADIRADIVPAKKILLGRDRLFTYKHEQIPDQLAEPYMTGIALPSSVKEGTPQQIANNVIVCVHGTYAVEDQESISNLIRLVAELAGIKASFDGNLARQNRNIRVTFGFGVTIEYGQGMKTTAAQIFQEISNTSNIGYHYDEEGVVLPLRRFKWVTDEAFEC